MKKTDVQIEGITYTVRSTTDAGLRDAIKQLKASIKRMMKQETKEDEDDGTGS